MKTIRAEITRLSGSGKRVVSTRRHGLYSSFTLPGLDDMPAVRDTLVRFDDFDVPERLDGEIVTDIGCNVGAVIFEAAKRGAAVQGVEYRKDRVTLCEAIAARYGFTATFVKGDFNSDDVTQLPSGLHKANKLFCCSVTEYIDDLPLFYNFMHELLKPGGVLYLECNRQRDWNQYDTINLLRETGFVEYRYLGNGHSGGISRKRKLFRAVRNES